MRFIPTGGHVHDSTLSEALTEGVAFDKLLADKLHADKGYDSDRFRAAIKAARAEAVIPSTGARSRAIPYDKAIYNDRALVLFHAVTHRRHGLLAMTVNRAYLIGLGSAEPKFDQS